MSPTPDRSAAVIEVWRAIPGFVGRYEVSSLGRVRSLLCREPKVRKTYPDKDGYPRIILITAAGKKCDPRLHRIVAEVFHASKRNALHREVAHLDGNRMNASADNLKWVSKAENCSHKLAHGTHQAGESHPSAALTEEQVRRIRTRYATASIVADDHGVSRHTIYDIWQGRRWKAQPGSRPEYTSVPFIKEAIANE